VVALVFTFGVVPYGATIADTAPPQAIRTVADTPPPAARHHHQTGIASWYGAQHNGRRTANGETLKSDLATAAHRRLPFGSLVKVTNSATGTVVVVRINDRGPYVDGRIIDLSESAARALGIVATGLAQVSLDLVTGTEVASR
jgi:rare lipoprotein A